MTATGCSPANCECDLAVRKELARKRLVDADALFREVVDCEGGDGHLGADIDCLCDPSEDTVVLLVEGLRVLDQAGLMHLLGQCVFRNLWQGAKAET